MRYLQRLDPRDGITDFWHEFRRPNPYRWRVLALSAAITFTLFYSFTQERGYTVPERPEIDYITTFDPARTDAQIAESNAQNQAFQDELASQIEEREEIKREMFRNLGRASGMDVDEIDRRAEEARAAEAAEREAMRENMLAESADGEPAGQAPAE